MKRKILVNQTVRYYLGMGLKLEAGDCLQIRGSTREEFVVSAGNRVITLCEAGVLAVERITYRRGIDDGIFMERLGTETIRADNPEYKKLERKIDGLRRQSR